MASIRQRGERVFQIRVFRGRDENGKQLSPYATTYHVPEKFKTQSAIAKEAERYAAVFEQECKKGLVATDHKKMYQYAEYFLSVKENEACKHRTLYRYRELLNDILPDIGHLKVEDIRADHLNMIYKKLRERGLSATTITHYHRLLHTVLELAKKEGVVAVNVAENVGPPKQERKEAETFQMDEVTQIQDCLRKEPLKWQCIMNLLLDTGARRGELLGLQWERIDIEHRSIKISKTILYSKDVGVYEDTTKTRQSRTIGITEYTANLLASFQREQNRFRLQMGFNYNQEGFLFIQDNGTPMHPDTITAYCRKLETRYKLPFHINPHKFRHTQASILYANNIDPVAISKRLGHTQVSTTQNFYAHLMEESADQASWAISNALQLKRQA